MISQEECRKEWRWYTLKHQLLGLAPLIVFVVMMALVILANVLKPDPTPAVYRAWKKIHPTQTLTFDEWTALRRANLLPK